MPNKLRCHTLTCCVPEVLQSCQLISKLRSLIADRVQDARSHFQWPDAWGANEMSCTWMTIAPRPDSPNPKDSHIRMNFSRATLARWKKHNAYMLAPWTSWEWKSTREEGWMNWWANVKENVTDEVSLEETWILSMQISTKTDFRGSTEAGQSSRCPAWRYWFEEGAGVVIRFHGYGGGIGCEVQNGRREIWVGSWNYLEWLQKRLPFRC